MTEIRVICTKCEKIFENVSLKEYLENRPYICKECDEKHKKEKEIENK